MQEQALLLHKQWYPTLWSGDQEPFKASEGWQYKFLRRNNFSIRCVTRNKRSMQSKEQMIEVIKEFHIETRIFQLESMNDPEYGLTSPQAVFNRDQVPIELRSSACQTIDEKGKDVIWDGVGGESDDKRFCTLNLWIPMEPREDGKNNIKPVLVFRASKFTPGDKWSLSNEREKWDPRVDVCFQENAWVDTRTNIFTIEKASECVSDWLKEEDILGVQFEDNLSSHKTEESQSAWKTSLPNFRPPRYYPPRLTGVVQSIDRHVGIHYKRGVYTDVREECLRRMWAAGPGNRPEPMTNAERRILITKSVANTHDRLWRTGMFKRVFIATGTWLPIDHLILDMSYQGVQKGKADLEVSLQGLPEYDYKELITRSVVRGAMQTRAEERARVTKQQEDALAAAAAEEERKRLMYAECERPGALVWTHVKNVSNILKDANRTCLQVLDASKQGKIVIGGSWPESVVVNAVCECFPDLEQVKHIDLKPDDIDVYYGVDVGDFRLTPGGNSYVNGVVEDFQINLVQLSGGLSVSNLMKNNDINVTSVCILVSLVNGEVQINWTIPPVFWHFVLKERILRPINMETPARTLIRIAYKSYKLGISSDCTGLDPMSGLLFKSHHKKFEDMGVWASSEASPLKNLKLKTVKENKEWKFTMKEKVKCSNCSLKWAHKKCVNLCCRQCCIVSDAVCRVHKKT